MAPKIREAPAWRLRPLPQRAELETAVERFGVSPMVAGIYLARGFHSRDDLEPQLAIPDWPQLFQAAQVLIEAIHAGSLIRIHGDYDADGITGSALLYLGLQELGARVEVFLPERSQGYGISAARIKEHATAPVFVSVDCGIASGPLLSQLIQAGVKVIVTDHHLPPATPPPGIVVHPDFSPAFSKAFVPTPAPSGAGVAFFLLWAVHKQLGLAPPWQYTDLAAVGTIADLVPLGGVNRALAQKGLAVLRDSQHPGLRALAALCCQQFDAGEIGFRLAPRINAAGRLGQARLAFETLIESDPGRAAALAGQLDVLNRTRQQLTEQAWERLSGQIDPDSPAQVLQDPEGHLGIIGLLASRVVETVGQPAFVVAHGHGSVRSLPGTHAALALAAAAPYLKSYGGHPQAAGFSLDMANFAAFRSVINDYVAAHPPEPTPLWLEGVLPHPREVPELLRALQRLEPFGQGNPAPLFLLTGIPQGFRMIGNGKHFRARVQGLEVVHFGGGAEISPGQALALAVTPEMHTFRGVSSLRVRAASYREISEVSLPDPEALSPLSQFRQAYLKNSRGEAIDPIFAAALNELGLAQGTTPASKLNPYSSPTFRELAISEALELEEAHRKHQKVMPAQE